MMKIFVHVRAFFTHFGKAFWKGFFLSGFVTLFFLASGTVAKTWHGMWIERQIPYDIEGTYTASRVVIFLRLYLQNKGWQEQGMLPRAFKRVHHYLYQKMLMQVPKEDGLRTMLKFE